MRLCLCSHSAYKGELPPIDCTEGIHNIGRLHDTNRPMQTLPATLMQLFLVMRCKIGDCSNETTMRVLHTLVHRIKSADSFEPHIEYDRVIMLYRVQFARSQESGRSILRLILPDEQGRRAPVTLANPCSRQWEALGTQSTKFRTWATQEVSAHTRRRP